MTIEVKTTETVGLWTEKIICEIAGIPIHQG
jgi:hypothetical protein